MASVTRIFRRAPFLLFGRSISTTGQKNAVDVAVFNKKTSEMMLKKDWLNKLDGKTPYYLSFIEPHLGKEFVPELAVADHLGSSVGTERYEQLQYLIGNDDPFGLEYRRIRKSSEKYPNLIPSETFQRNICCECETDAQVRYTTLFKGATQRCYCGHFLKLVTQEEKDAFDMKHIVDWLNQIDKQPEDAKKVYDNLKSKFESLVNLTSKIESQGQKKLGVPVSDALPGHTKISTDVVKKTKIDDKLLDEYNDLTHEMQLEAAKLYAHYEHNVPY